MWSQSDDERGNAGVTYLKKLAYLFWGDFMTVKEGLKEGNA